MIDINHEIKLQKSQSLAKSKVFPFTNTAVQKKNGKKSALSWKKNITVQPKKIAS